MEIKADSELIDNILNFSYSIDPVPNFMIISINIYNLIESDITFKRSEDSELGSLYRVGYIKDFEVYVDIYLSPDTILISWNKQENRNNKIDSILNGVNQLDDIVISVI